MNTKLSQMSTLQAIFAEFVHPVVLANYEGGILCTNQSFAGLAGKPSPHDFVECIFGQLFDNADSTRIRMFIADADKTSLEIVSSGEFFPKGLHLLLSKMHLGDEQFLLIQIYDLGEILFEKNFSMHARRQKLENLGLLASGIAHDLNNIMTSVLGNLSVLGLLIGKDTMALESLQAVEEGARRAAALTRKVLSNASSKENELGKVDLRTVVDDCVALLRPGLHSGIDLSVNLPVTPCCLFGDSSELFQLVMNLLLNATQSLPDRGSVTVSLAHILTDEDITLAYVNSAKRALCRLRVEDTGSGIPAGIQDRVFEPFFTTRSNCGSGLGLAVVKTITELYKGFISISSTQGQGTCFDVFLPIELEEKGISRSVDNSPTGKLPPGNELILVVDDEEPVRTVIKKCLEHLGYQVVAVASGAEGLKFYMENSAQCALVILDMMMPGMTGDELFFRLQKFDPHVKVLIASGFASDERSRAVLDSGGLGFLEKPFAVEELAQTVRQCIDLRGP